MPDGSLPILVPLSRADRKNLMECRYCGAVVSANWAAAHRESHAQPFCDECSGPYPLDEWPGSQYSGHWDTCPNRTYKSEGHAS